MLRPLAVITLASAACATAPRPQPLVSHVIISCDGQTIDPDTIEVACIYPGDPNPDGVTAIVRAQLHQAATLTLRMGRTHMLQGRDSITPPGATNTVVTSRFTLLTAAQAYDPTTAILKPIDAAAMLR